MRLRAGLCLQKLLALPLHLLVNWECFLSFVGSALAFGPMAGMWGTASQFLSGRPVCVPGNLQYRQCHLLVFVFGPLWAILEPLTQSRPSVRVPEQGLSP